MAEVQNPTLPALQIGEDTNNAAATMLEQYTAQLLDRYHRMGGPVDLPERKPVSEVLSEYISAFSKKKSMVLALADVEVACEEGEAVLVDVYGAAHVKQLRGIHYITDEPTTAIGRYFDGVSAIRFDPDL